MKKTVHNIKNTAHNIKKATHGIKKTALLLVIMLQASIASATIKISHLTQATDTEQLVEGTYIFMYGVNSDSHKSVYLCYDWIVEDIFGMNFKAIDKSSDTTISPDMIINGKPAEGMTYAMFSFEKAPGGWYIYETRHKKYLGYNNTFAGYNDIDGQRCLWDISVNDKQQIEISRCFGETRYILKLKTSKTSVSVNLYADKEQNEALPCPEIYRMDYDTSISGGKVDRKRTADGYTIGGTAADSHTRQKGIVIMKGRKKTYR